MKVLRMLAPGEGEPQLEHSEDIVLSVNWEEPVDNTGEEIVGLKILLNTPDASDETVLEHITTIADRLNLWSISSVEELCAHPDFLRHIEELIRDQEEQELAQGNKRTIDRYFFDPLNKALDLKTRVYNRLMRDPQTTPTVSPNATLTHMDETYFAFDASIDGWELQKLQKAYPTVQVDPALPNDIQRVIYKAFERYPELAEKNISFVAVDGFKIMSSKQHVMRSQVKMWSLLRELVGLSKREDRAYVIQVNLLDRDGVVVLPKVTQYSKWWVMTHEFAHTEDYTKKTPWEVLKFWLWFALSPRWVRNMERKTDETAIARGAWYGLYLFRREIHERSAGAYVDYKKRTYLWPKEILYAILKHHTAYDEATLAKVIEHIAREEF